MSVDAVMSRCNPLVVRVLHSPFHWPLSTGLLLLTYTGRVSGRSVTLPVGYQRVDDRVTVLVSEAATKRWWRNFRDPAEVSLRIRGRAHDGRARLVAPDEPAFREAAERTLRRVPGMGRVFKVNFDRRRGLTAEQLAHLSREIAIVAIHLDGDDPSDRTDPRDRADPRDPAD
jgi:deazaflavin-dependent oxidoreductase (nitroreductase family)